VSLTEGTVGVTLPNAVRVLRLDLLGLGLFANTGGLGLLGTPRVHTTVTRTHESTIAARCPLTSHPLARLFAGLAEEGQLGTQGGNFGEEGVHGGRGSFV
jgi:hypothetical protein